MAVARIIPHSGKEKKQLVRKDVVERIVQVRLKMHGRKLADAIALANRWGAKAVEFEKGKLEAEAQIKGMWIAIGGLVGYDIILTIIGCLSRHTSG
jgi:hypothetical protein